MPGMKMLSAARGISNGDPALATDGDADAIRASLKERIMGEIDRLSDADLHQIAARKNLEWLGTVGPHFDRVRRASGCMGSL